MRLGDFNCGCQDRKYIMFEAGRLGLPEAAVLAAAVLAIVLARKVSK